MLKPTFNNETRVWSGPKMPPLYNPDQNLGQLIVRVLEQTPDAVTQISADTGVEVTCGEMRERILKVAVHLSNLGLKQGDVVGVVAGNTENLAPAAFACFLLGLPVNPLAPIMTEADIVQMYSKTKPKLILCDGGNVKIVQNAVNTMKSEVMIYTIMEKVNGYECVSEIIRNPHADFTVPAVDPSSPAFIICSSGSTGSPKGTCRTHREIITHFVPSSVYNSNGPTVVYQFSAIFWFSGVYSLIMCTLYKSVRVISAQPSTAQLMIDIINRFKVTNVFTAPYAIVNLLQQAHLRPFESVRSWIVGGASISRALCEKLGEFVPNGVISGSYGSSEYGFITNNHCGAKPGSCGLAFENIDVKVVDESGKSLDCNQLGEFWVRRELPFSGYFGEAEKTQEAFDGEWFRTGDIGYFDDDGYIYVIDRKKELLKFNNYQVTPSELEALINEIDGVVSSCVVGVLEENTGNDIIHAFVIVDESMSELSEKSIEKFVSDRVIDQKRLRGGVHILKAFPLGPSGKVDKKRLKTLAEENFSE